MGKNGYFQLQMKEDGTYVRLFPPVSGGDPIQLNELRQYLALKNHVPDLVKLNAALFNLSQPVDFKLDEKKGLAELEMFMIRVTEDKMTAFARFYPPSNEGASLNKEEIINDLKHKGVTFGVDESAIEKFLTERVYCTDYVIANGKPPVQGQDASIEYFFNTNPNTKPALNADGTVDFFHLDVISKCEKGQLLARLHPEIPGKVGVNVLGEHVPVRDVVRKRLRFERNITLSEDQLTITSNIDGHVSLNNDLVSVTDTYQVNDVDTATGNIEYNGNVVVEGNVKAGFSVVANGNIEVRGVVEGAFLKSGGDIIIARGMNGMGKGTLDAAGNVVSKFIENATVNAGGYVHAEAIMHSTINTKSDVTVTGKRGFITGGLVRSLGTVSAKTIGSTMGVGTDIEIAVDPTVKNRIQELTKSIVDSRKQISLLEPTLITFTKRIKHGDKLSMDQIMTFKQMTNTYQQLKPQLQKDEAELEALTLSMESMTTDAIVKASEFVYPGVNIRISDISMSVNSVIQHSRFEKEGADIRIKPL